MQQIIELISIILKSEEMLEPSCDVYEKNGMFYINLEVPGLDEDQLKVEIYGDGVEIEGVKKKNALREVKYLRAERMFGHFKRFIELPCCIEKVEALQYSRGILTITVSKR